MPFSFSLGTPPHFLFKLSCSVLEIGFVEVCGFEFEGFKQRRILKILRQTVDFSGSKALIAQICDEVFSVQCQIEDDDWTMRRRMGKI